MPRLVYSSDREPGLRREGSQPPFRVVRPDGTPETDEATLSRVARLAIPPAYQNVWICTRADGHLQATGRDARGRKQYRYHAAWRELRDREKFDRMGAFGAALPRLRRHVYRDLASPGLDKRKVVALAVRILDLTMIRIGNEAYTRSNQSYGLTTLRNRHVRFVSANRIVLSFRGKSGVEQQVSIADRQIVRHVRRCMQLPGQLLFQYLDEGGVRRAVTSDMVNDYIQRHCGEGASAKDFRTWGATLIALRLLARTPVPQPASDRQCALCINKVVRDVASMLGNTVAVCRKSYINPVVFDAWREARLPRVTRSDAAIARLLASWSTATADSQRTNPGFAASPLLGARKTSAAAAAASVK